MPLSGGGATTMLLSAGGRVEMRPPSSFFYFFDLCDFAVKLFFLTFEIDSWRSILPRPIAKSIKTGYI
jgi:hypothetical protein